MRLLRPRPAHPTQDQKRGDKTHGTRRRETKSHTVCSLRARTAIQHTLRILPQDCDNEAVVHNKEKLFENHNPESIT